jgi:DNA-binding transcriptional ArsR family regulator
MRLSGLPGNLKRTEDRMPSPLQQFISLPTAPDIRVALDPAQNAFFSLMLLAEADKVSGFGGWIPGTAQELTAEEMKTHRLVMLGFYHALQPRSTWSSFPHYLEHLASLPPSVLVDRMLDTYARIPLRTQGEPCWMLDEPASIDRQAVLASPEAYIDFLRQRFDESHIDVEVETAAYHLAIDPPRMQALFIAHLRMMWDRFLAAEWERTRPILQEVIRACQQVDLSRMDRMQAARHLTGQELAEPKWEESLRDADHVVFVPNPHSGPYVGRFLYGKTLGILFGARLPKGASVEVPELSRSEIIVRLAALADDNRLRILKYIGDHGEQRAQDLIQVLEMSQSAASRHLSQLTATGYLRERRLEGGKFYTLNTERVEDTLQALSAFLLGTPDLVIENDPVYSKGRST